MPRTSPPSRAEPHELYTHQCTHQCWFHNSSYENYEQLATAPPGGNIACYTDTNNSPPVWQQPLKISLLLLSNPSHRYPLHIPFTHSAPLVDLCLQYCPVRLRPILAGSFHLLLDSSCSHNSGTGYTVQPMRSPAVIYCWVFPGYSRLHSNA